MIEKFVDKLVNNQLKEKKIPQEEINIYKYGYTLLCEVFLNIIIAIIIGVLSEQLINITLFLVIYIPMRSFCGGWHADKIWKCTIFSNLILVAMVLIDYQYSSNFKMIVMVIVFGICLAAIFWQAPIDTKSKPISRQEKEVYKKKISIIMLIHTVFIGTALMFGYKSIIFVFTYSYIIQYIMLVLETLNKKLEK